MSDNQIQDNSIQDKAFELYEKYLNDLATEAQTERNPQILKSSQDQVFGAARLIYRLFDEIEIGWLTAQYERVYKTQKTIKIEDPNTSEPKTTPLNH